MKRRAEAVAVFRELEGLLAIGTEAAVAMVVRIAGSAYRRPGARMLVAADGRTWGGISAGCLEEDVRLHALDALVERRPVVLNYDTSSIDVDGLALGCDGKLEILVRPFRPDEAAVVREVRRALGSRRRVAIAWGLPDASGAADRAPFGVMADMPLEMLGVVHSREVPVLSLARDMLEDLSASPVAVDEQDSAAFTERLDPAPQLLVCGGGLDSKPLVELGHHVGFDVTVVDHKPGKLRPELYSPGIHLQRARPGDGFERELVEEDMVVIKTHSFRQDAAWLEQVKSTNVAYIGLMGPRSRVGRLREAAGDDVRIFGPVGLDVGARGAEQIAVAIVAEMLAVRSGRRPQHLRDRVGPIHSV